MSAAPVIVIGSGLAGLMTALTIAPQPVMLVTAGTFGCDGSSTLAQGGIAASLGEDDSPALHLADTLAAGDGLCEASVAADIIEAAAETIAVLENYGVYFDKGRTGHMRSVLRQRTAATALPMSMVMRRERASCAFSLPKYGRPHL